MNHVTLPIHVNPNHYLFRNRQRKVEANKMDTKKMRCIYYTSLITARILYAPVLAGNKAPPLK